MPQVEVRTRLRPQGRMGPELVMELLITPRGSGNSKLARALAKSAKQHPNLGPHVKRATAGSSKVWVVFRPSWQLTKAILELQASRVDTPDVPGQLPLFGGPMPT